MTRIDKLLPYGRDRAKEIIKAGRVTVNGKTVFKPSELVDEESKIVIRDEEREYISRGGKKLEQALLAFSLDVSGKTALDVGASTGGFTDCLLRNGAIKVIALDSGHGQLAEALRNDERVMSLEGVNIRSCPILPFTPDIITVDVSFISLSLVLPELKKISSDETKIVCLVKPQFEAGKKYVGKNGVVKGSDAHERVLLGFFSSAMENGFGVTAVTNSPILGPEGNVEFLALLEKKACSPPDASETVKKAYERLGIK